MKLQPIRKERLPGRNEKCPCGSGKKAKKCCLPRIKAAGRLAARRPRRRSMVAEHPRPLAHRGADATQPRKDRLAMRHATLLLILVLAGCQRDPPPRPILVPVPRPRPIIVPVPMPRPRPIIVPGAGRRYRRAGGPRPPSDHTPSRHDPHPGLVRGPSRHDRSAPVTPDHPLTR